MLGKPVEYIERRIAKSPLNLADIGAINSSISGQGLLRLTSRGAKPA
jgi:hypothetical protein